MTILYVCTVVWMRADLLPLGISIIGANGVLGVPLASTKVIKKKMSENEW